MTGDTRLQNLEDELKLLKGEIKNTLLDLRAYVMRQDSPLVQDRSNGLGGGAAQPARSPEPRAEAIQPERTTPERQEAVDTAPATLSQAPPPQAAGWGASQAPPSFAGPHPVDPPPAGPPLVGMSQHVQAHSYPSSPPQAPTWEPEPSAQAHYPGQAWTQDPEAHYEDEEEEWEMADPSIQRRGSQLHGSRRRPRGSDGLEAAPRRGRDRMSRRDEMQRRREWEAEARARQKEEEIEADYDEEEALEEEPEPQARNGTGPTAQYPLDISLITGLVQWTWAAKRRIGLEGLMQLLDLYIASGHGAPGLRKMVLHMAKMVEMAPSEGACNDPAQEAVDLMHRLHGILTSNLAGVPLPPFDDLGKPQEAPSSSEKNAEPES